MRWAIKTQSDYRVSAKTHPIVIIELVGYQWALSEAMDYSENSLVTKQMLAIIFEFLDASTDIIEGSMPRVLTPLWNIWIPRARKDLDARHINRAVVEEIV